MKLESGSAIPDSVQRYIDEAGDLGLHPFERKRPVVKSIEEAGKVLLDAVEDGPYKMIRENNAVVSVAKYAREQENPSAVIKSIVYNIKDQFERGTYSIGLDKKAEQLAYRAGFFNESDGRVGLNHN